MELAGGRQTPGRAKGTCDGVVQLCAREVNAAGAKAAGDEHLPRGKERCGVEVPRSSQAPGRAECSRRVVQLRARKINAASAKPSGGEHLPRGKERCGVEPSGGNQAPSGTK